MRANPDLVKTAARRFGASPSARRHRGENATRRDERAATAARAICRLNAVIAGLAACVRLETIRFH